MARKVNKKIKKDENALELKSFGGTKELGNVKFDGHKHEVQTTEFQSTRHLEDDPNEGREAILRRFTFGMNVQAFKEARPTKQDIFNAHLKGIETMLWRDGMKVFPDVEPRITFDEAKMQYHIFVAARPQKGHILTQAPQSLSDIVHGV